MGFTNNDSLRPIIRTTSSGSLMGTFRNQYGCTLTKDIPIRLSNLDAKAFATPVTTVYTGDLVTLNATPTGTGYTYKWSTAGNPTTQTITVNPTASGNFIVTVTDVATGCTDTGQVFLVVLSPQCAEPFVFIPRAFSPNGDGKNDVIYVHGEYLKEVEFVIYNRWGEQVFVTKDKAIGWDGKHRGEPVCPDVYGYYVKGLCQQGEVFFKKGNITVLI